MRVVALIATYNERRFIGACLEHLHGQGVETYLIDNCSTDDTVAIAEGYLDHGLIGIESFPRNGVFEWRALLRRKEELARELDADWFIHNDADEFRFPPAAHTTLASALEEADRNGFTAVNFNEFTFIPTRERPYHDHHEFRDTLRTYYPFAPFFPHQLNAWKATSGEIGLARTGGHKVAFPGLAMPPAPFPMRHYLFLSKEHAVEKYVQRQYAPAETESGWHGWRATIDRDGIKLPTESQVRIATPYSPLDGSDPATRHFVAV